MGRPRLGQALQSGRKTVGAPKGARLCEPRKRKRGRNANAASFSLPDNNQTAWQYGGLGQMTLQTNALAASEQYYYNAAGELTETIDADGRAITYAYDGIGRETVETWYGSVGSNGNPVGSPTETMGYTYDAAGLLQTASDANASYAYTYDAAGEVASETQQIAGLSPTITFSEQYAAGNRTQLAASIGGTNDFVDNYQHQSVLGQMSQVTQTSNGGTALAAKTATFQYDLQGEFTFVTRYQNADATANLVAQAAYLYDAEGDVTSLVYSQGSTTLASNSCTYGPLGYTEPPTSNPAGTVSYTSDSTGQLLTATGGPTNESYSYDANGNRTSTGYVTGTNNEVLSDGTYTYFYDLEGNRTARWVQATSNSGLTAPAAGDIDITTYTWDNRDRLTAVNTYSNYTKYHDSTPDQTVTYAYDVFNRWIGETVTARGATTQTWFVYDGDQIVLQFDKTGAGDAAASDLSHRYLWGPAVDQLLADDQLQGTPQVVWTFGDNQNTVCDLAVYSGGVTTIVNDRVFSAYGQLLSQTNPQTSLPAAVDCLFGFTGQAYDSATGLQNNLNRWYDAGAGDWMSEDPIGFAGGDANLYRYCGNSPLDAYDSFGLWTANIGISASSTLFWIVGGGGSGGIVVDGQGNVGFYLTGMVGRSWGPPSALIGVTAGGSSAAKIGDLRGSAAAASGSIDAGVGLGVDGYIMPRPCGGTIKGGDLSAGLGFGAGLTTGGSRTGVWRVGAATLC